MSSQANDDPGNERPMADAATAAGIVFMSLAGSTAIVVILIGRWGLGFEGPGLGAVGALLGLGVGFSAAVWMVVSGPLQRR